MVGLELEYFYIVLLVGLDTKIRYTVCQLKIISNNLIRNPITGTKPLKFNPD